MSDSPSPRSAPVKPENLPPAPSSTSISLQEPVKHSAQFVTSEDNSSKPSFSSFIPAWRRPTISATDPDGNSIRRPSVQFVPNVAKESPHSRSSSAKAPILRSVNLDGSSWTPQSGARRLSSPPPPAQFRSSVSFDTFRNPSASEYSLTLNRKHRDYEYTKRSRTFLCGTDTNEYSDTALEWLIDELVDDGDEVVCLRVVETDSKEAQKWSRGQGEKGYRQEAQNFLEAIERKNTDDRAISLVLEFAIGKVHDTIQHMIRIYEPAMLVVGTRGRSLTGYQGLLSGSVSKYCLQYSPVPVIVVRPSRKREAKKRKRLQDPTRTGYRDILDKSEDAPRGRGGHLLDERHRMSHLGGAIGALGELESDDPAEEARRVAEAIGYRGAHDHRANHGEARAGSLSRVTTVSTRTEDDGAERVLKSPDSQNLDSPGASDDNDDDVSEPEEELGRLQESIRPEDEAALLAYERAQKAAEEEQEEAEARKRREQERSASRGRGPSGLRTHSHGRGNDEDGGGAAVLGLLAQLDRGVIK